MFDFNLLHIIAGLPGLLIAMVVHEYAHAQVAVWLGDFTPRLMGRLTLNPKAHIDPIGMLMLFLVHFGWAKPVQINPRNFKSPQRDDILVSLAGPFANFLTAFLAMAVYMLLIRVGAPVTEGVKVVFRMIVLYNLGFGVFNLIPLPPLDGSHVLMQILPRDMAYKLAGLERYSFLILIVLLMTPVLSMILVPCVSILSMTFHTILTAIIF